MAHTRIHNTGDGKYSAQYNNLVLEYTNLTEPASHSHAAKGKGSKKPKMNMNTARAKY